MPGTSSPRGDLVVELLPARHGDAVLLTWGEEGRRRRMLVDGGPATAYDAVRARLVDVAADGLDLLVLTHIDGDHIDGLILLVNDASLALGVGEVWFNGSAQLVDDLGPVTGEILSALVATRGIGWNAQFDHRAVCVDDDGPLPVRELPGGLRLTVLGPDRPTLRRLRDEWRTVCEEAGLGFGAPEEALAVLRKRRYLRPAAAYLGADDRIDVHALATTAVGKDYALANKSSIVLLAEYGDARVLLAGDATPGALVPAVRRLLTDLGLDRLPLSAFKLPHHGSAANVTAEVVALVPSRHYLFSSDGSHFGHPDACAVARVLEAAVGEVDLVFNYRSEQTTLWSDERPPPAGYRWTTRFPGPGSAGTALTLSADTGAAR